MKKAIKQIYKGLKDFSEGRYLFVCWAGVICSTVGNGFTTQSDAIAKVKVVINAAIGFSGIVCVGIIVYGAYLFLLSGGDEEKISQGKNTLTNGVIGLIVIFIAVLIITFVTKVILKW